MARNRLDTTAARNLGVLRLTALLFFVFVVCECVGAYVSNSLSLLGDAIAMSIDVLTYCINIYVEGDNSFKSSQMTFLPISSFALVQTVN